MITKWLVNNYLDKPEKKEYSRETRCFYVHVDGRGRDAKVGGYEFHFDSENDALEYIAEMALRRDLAKKAGQIKLHAAELLEALEWSLVLMEGMVVQLDPNKRSILQLESDGMLPAQIIRARYAIAKAKGLTQ